MAFSKKPPQPPKADMSALVSALNEARAKVGLAAHISTLPLWKRYVESVSEYDTTGIRDVVNSNAIALDDLKADHDTLAERERSDVAALSSRVAALEAQQLDPFPGYG